MIIKRIFEIDMGGKMNQREFIERSDKIIYNMNLGELRNSLHNVARKTPENKRELFLQLLNDSCNQLDDKENNEKTPYKKLMADEKVNNKLIEISNVFEKIENAELCLSAQGYEDYTYGYWQDDWIWEYEDSGGIGRIIEDAALFAHDCMNDFRYDEAISVFNLIMNTTYYADDEGGDLIELNLEEMVKENLTYINLRNLALEVLYSEYQVQPAKERASILYDYFNYSYFNEIQIEDILSIGREELKDIDVFLQSWIDFLMQQNGEIASRLLKEGILYYKGSEGLAEIARKSFKEHPSVYLAAILEYEKTHDYEKMKEIGKEALDKLDRDLKLRGEIAIKTSQASWCINDFEYMRRCWYEAFYSDSTIANYLRIFANKEALVEYRELIGKRIEELTITDTHNYRKSTETEKNNINEIDYKLLHFFSGHFDKVKNWCIEQKNPLGWSGKFISYGVHLLLLYLYSDSAPGKACKKIADNISTQVCLFTGKNLVFMTENSVFETDASMQRSGEVFWNVFNIWKLNYNMSSDEVNSFVDWLETIISKRVDGIVGGKYRNSYGKAALLVAALGEVKESLGTKSAKSFIINEYMKKYPRHTSFRGALREYV